MSITFFFMCYFIWVTLSFLMTVINVALRWNHNCRKKGAGLHETERVASVPALWMILPWWKDVSQIDHYNPSTSNHLALQQATHKRGVVVCYQNTMHRNLAEGERATNVCLHLVGFFVSTHSDLLTPLIFIHVVSLEPHWDCQLLGRLCSFLDYLIHIEQSTQYSFLLERIKLSEAVGCVDEDVSVI